MPAMFADMIGMPAVGLHRDKTRDVDQRDYERDAKIG